MKNIDNEINKLLEIKNEVLTIKKAIEQSQIVIIPISQCKYNEFISKGIVQNNVFYYIVEPEIGQYIEEYIC